MRAPWYARLLLRLFPADVREAHGREILTFWAAQASEPRYRGVFGRARLTVAVGSDAVRRGLGMRVGGIASSGLRADAGYAVRGLRRAPLFAVGATLTLGLGIGAATAVFAVVDAVVLRPLPFPDADRLVEIPRSRTGSDTPQWGWLDYQDLQSGAADRIRLAGHTEANDAFEWPDGAESHPGARVTRNWFDVMGVPPLLGRSFSEEEDTRGGPDAVILSHDLWRTRFAADPAVLGRTVPMDGGNVPVVGVMPPGFRAPTGDAAYWTPLQEEEILQQVGLPLGTRSLNYFSVVGRLPEGADPDAVEAELARIAGANDRAAGKDADDRIDLAVVPMLDGVVGGVRSTLFMILAAAGMVLVVAASNVAGLALSRAAVRERELLVRAALGASRGRIVRQLLAESAVLALAAGMVGLGVGAALLEGVLRLAPPGLPRMDAVALDGRALLFAAAAAVASGALFGLFPALRGSRTDIAGGMRGGARGASADGKALRPQQVLVSVQVAVAVVLLVGSGLLVNSFRKLSAVELGFAHESVVVASVAPSESRYATPADVDAFYERVLDEVRRIPGVAAAASTYSPPLTGNDFFTTVRREEDPDVDENRLWVGTVIVRNGYFDANGVPIVEGRGFDGSERLGEPPVAVVSRAMADRLWPGEPAVGKRFVFTGGLRGSADSFDRVYFPREPYTVVGVAADVHRTGPADPPTAEYYRPHGQITWGFQYLVVRTHGSVDDLAGQLRSAVWAVDATVPVPSVRALSGHLRDQVAEPRFRMLLLVAFGSLTAALAMVGLYAVMTLAVARRTREMGVRMALGASRHDVVRGVLGRGAHMVAWGVAAGLLAAWLGSRVLASMLFDLSPTDLPTYAAVTALVVGVALLACWTPAWRAGRIDPVRSLAEE